MNELEKYTTKEELFAHLKANKATYIAQKKATVKAADAVSYCERSYIDGKGEAVKELTQSEMLALDEINVKSVINTTNILDSHGDVHIPGLWNKSLKEQKQFYLVKEHAFNFDNIISDRVKASAETMSWKALGFDWAGNTQALVFDSVISKADSPQMFTKYAQGKVPNHSVGMQYVKIALAVNSDISDLKEEKKAWDKYINEIINKEDAERQGYFWAVTEAKIVEGSAVLRGSNYATPTLNVTGKDEPSQDTRSIFGKVGQFIN